MVNEYKCGLEMTFEFVPSLWGILATLYFLILVWELLGNGTRDYLFLMSWKKGTEEVLIEI